MILSKRSTMNEDYNKLMTTRLRCIQTNMIKMQEKNVTMEEKIKINQEKHIIMEDKIQKMQEKIRRFEFLYFGNKQNIFRHKNEGLLTDKYFGNEIIMIDFEDETNTFENSEIINQFPRTKTSDGQKASEPPKLAWLMNMKRNWLYYSLCAVVYAFCFTISVYLIVTTYDSWQSSPVVQATSNNQIPIKNIPFPAVSFCWPDVLKSDYDFLKLVKDCLDCRNQTCKLKKGNCNETALKTLTYFRYVCYKFSYDNKIAEPLDTLLKEHIPVGMDEEEFNKYITKVLPPCEVDSLIMGKFFGFENPKIISRCNSDDAQQFVSLAPNRLCMTVNSLPHGDIFQEGVFTTLPRLKNFNNHIDGHSLWSFDNMMEFNGGLNSTPIYGMKGIAFGMYQPANKYGDICTEYKNTMISIMIHSPNEIPLLEEIATKIHIRQDIIQNIIIDPKIVTARKDLVQYSPQQRGCFYTHEKKLAMFKFYTHNNCLVECYVNTYLSLCGCVPLEYPRPNSSVKVCSTYCAAIYSNIYNPDCNCLPDCNSLRYEITLQEMELMPIDVKNQSIRALIQMSFQKSMFLTNVRYSITSYIEFVTLGLGVLGAFLGVSVTCVWHLLYDEAKKLAYIIRTVWKKKVSPMD